MELGIVTGSVWATKKNESLNGIALRVVELMNHQEVLPRRTVIAADLIGAGEGDQVLVTFGGSARYAVPFLDAPLDAAIVGIVDSVEA